MGVPVAAVRDAGQVHSADPARRPRGERLRVAHRLVDHDDPDPAVDRLLESFDPLRGLEEGVLVEPTRVEDE